MGGARKGCFQRARWSKSQDSSYFLQQPFLEEKSRIANGSLLVDLAVEAAGAVDREVAVAGGMAVDQQMATAVDQGMAGEVMALALMALHMDRHTALDF